ncbi:MAG: efflux transporter outer membrane subunit [Sphingomonadales bacterium]|nr:efflux transporter outer membrane subunit [Sphingomonadales bacterium]MDE2171031.1 efflux transporter outer membrane subunit [Sphingomonadales bacterium]
MIRRLVCLTLLLASGCAGVQPETSRLPPEAATGPWPYRPPTVAQTTPRDDWWRLYDDTALDALIAQALASNTDLRAAQAHVDAARALLREAGSARLPVTTLSTGESYGRTSTATQIADAAGRQAPDLSLFQAGFDMAYEVDLFGRVRRSIEASRADAQAAAAARDGVQVTIIAETVRDYVQACSLGEQLDVAGQALAIARQQADILRRQAAAGGASRLDVARQDLLVSRTSAALPELEGARRAVLFALAAVLGQGPGDVPPAAAACHVIPRPGGPIPVGDGAQLLIRRPDIRQADREMTAAAARIGMARAALFPRITLMGSVSSVTTDVAATGSRPATSFALGPLVSWTFPNIAAAQARIAQARASDRAAVATYDGVVLKALKEVEQAMALYTAALERERDLATAQRQAGITYDLAQGRLNAGSDSRLDVLLAEQGLIEARLALAAASAARAERLVALFKALGGGWRQAAP